MKNKILVIMAACLSALLIRCTTAPLAGGTDNPDFIVMGLVKDANGKPAQNAIVTILPESYNPITDTAPAASMIDTTDTTGTYRLAVSQNGMYNVQAFDPLKKTRLLVTGISVIDDTSHVSPAALSSTGSIKVALSQEDINFETGYIYVPGTNIFTFLKNSIDSVVIDSVPSGTLPILVYALTGSTASHAIRYGVMVASGKTTAVWNPFWNYSRNVFLNTTASGANVTGNVMNFPVLVRLCASNFDFSQAQSAGADIRFTKQDNTPLKYEIERWDVVNKQAEIWVKVDTVYGNSSTQYISMYWGNWDASETSNGADVFDTTNKFIGVWHMNEDPSNITDAIKDRTFNAFNASPFGLMTASNSISGAIGKALTFDGVDDYLDAGVVSVPKSYSIGLWVQLGTVGVSQRFVFKDSSYTLWYESDKDTNTVRMEHMSTTTWWRGLLEDGGKSVSMSTGTWCYLLGTFDETKMRLYKNGVEVSSSNAISVIPRIISKPLFFGKSWDIDYVNGSMDEIRIEGTARSADWALLCYMNQRTDDKLTYFE
jgi:hypothetical protein